LRKVVRDKRPRAAVRAPAVEEEEGAGGGRIKVKITDGEISKDDFLGFHKV